MAPQLFSAWTLTPLLILLALLVRRFQKALIPRKGEKTDHVDFSHSLPEPSPLAKRLASALPDATILPSDASAFRSSMNAYWARQEWEVIPACVVRPRDVKQLSTAVAILKREYDERKERAGAREVEGIFAVRSGGHSPVHGAASVKGGVVVDLSLFRDVTPSEDGSRVVIGTGAKWADVSRVLDKKGLVVVGGRNAEVGVGGLILGGKLLSFTECSLGEC